MEEELRNIDIFLVDLSSLLQLMMLPKSSKTNIWNHVFQEISLSSKMMILSKIQRKEKQNKYFIKEMATVC